MDASLDVSTKEMGKQLLFLKLMISTSQSSFPNLGMKGDRNGVMEVNKDKFLHSVIYTVNIPFLYFSLLPTSLVIKT